jgi:hypothetical protein
MKERRSFRIVPISGAARLGCNGATIKVIASIIYWQRHRKVENKVINIKKLRFFHFYHVASLRGALMFKAVMEINFRLMALLLCDFHPKPPSWKMYRSRTSKRPFGVP